MTTIERTSADTKLLDCMDVFMQSITHQSVVDSGRVIDFCLDIRQIVTEHEEENVN